MTFAEGLYREAAKLLHLDPARQQGLAPPRLPATCGVHPSVGAMLAWRYAQLLWALPNRGGNVGYGISVGVRSLKASGPF